MSKKKDRNNTEFRYCPICGSKAIIVSTYRIKKGTYIECQMCGDTTKVEVM